MGGETQYVGTVRQPKKPGQFDTVYTAGRVNAAIIDKIKAPFMDSVNVIMSDAGWLDKFKAGCTLYELSKEMEKLPEPTKANTRWKNTDILIDLRDEFFRLENNPGRERAFRAIWNFAIILYDYDPYYQHRIDWLIEAFLKVAPSWEGREPHEPALPTWREFAHLYPEPATH